MCLSAAIGKTILHNRRPSFAIQLLCEPIDHVPARVSMLWPHVSSEVTKHVAGTNDSLILKPWLQNNPDAQGRFWHRTFASACIPELLWFGVRLYSTAHSTLHRCASFYCGAQKAVPNPKKPWTSQGTAALSVSTGLARHQLRNFQKKGSRLTNTKCVMPACHRSN